MKAIKLITAASIAATIGLAASGRVDAASLIYDNGPINGNIDAWQIGGGQDVEDSFTVSGPTTLGSAQAGLWLDTGATPTSLDWSIGTTPGG